MMRLVAVLCLGAFVVLSAVSAEEPAPAPEKPKVAAVVNGKDVPSGLILRRFEAFKKGPGFQQEMAPQIMKNLVDEAVAQEIVDQFLATRPEIQVADAEVDAQIEEVKKQAAPDMAMAGKTFEDMIQAEGLTMKEFREVSRLHVRLTKYIDTQVSDDKIKTWTPEEKTKYAVTQDLVRASHILAKVDEGAAEQAWTDARKKVDDLRKKIDAGDAFEKVAKSDSDCPSKEQGGDLGYFPRKGRMVEEFAKAAFEMETGKVSEPVKSPFGWHLIKVTDHLKAGVDLPPGLEQVKIAYSRILFQKLRADAKVEVKM